MPPIHGWPYASAGEAARAIRAGEISSAELTKLMLDRIERLNPRINAIVTLTADAAMKRAREADAALAKREVWGPLHGVPCTVNDTFETAGVRTTAGAPFLWLEKAYEDHDPNLPFLACLPLRDALRSDPGFRDNLRRMNLPQ